MKEFDDDRKPEAEGLHIDHSEAETLDRLHDTVAEWHYGGAGSPAATFGPYRILELLGEGGMGAVYLAEQSEPIRRTVALKILGSAVATDRMIRRFEAERQALALMNHPNIARVYDAGSTDLGQRYFAMEYVRGEPITRYADSKRLDLDRRLQLFLQVCDGVQHAHQKGIIHRDLKPSNVLVAENGGLTPKIIDFGIAKALDEPLTERPLDTENRLLGTPVYMSPERIDPKRSHEVDTRSDIYSLGVLLYVLMVGCQPFENPHSSFLELAAMVLDHEVEPPSLRLDGTDSERLAIVARNRDSDPRELQRRLQGDLDWITMKAIAKDPARRYPSAAGLAADIRRHLDHRPVHAGPRGAGYRLSKFLRRHRIAVASAAMICAAVLAGVAGTVRQAQRANREAETARQVTRFLVDTFRVVDPLEGRGETVTVREVLDRGAERAVRELSDQPLTQAQLLDTIGSVYLSLGLSDRAEPPLRRAVRIRDRLLEDDHPDLATSLDHLASVLRGKARYDEAEQMFLRALRIRERALPADNPEIATSLLNLGSMYDDLARYDEAQWMLERSLDILESSKEPGGQQLLASLNNLGNLYRQQGRYEDSAEIYTRALDLAQQLYPPDHARVGISLTSLGTVIMELGHHVEAERLFTRALDIFDNSLPADHPAIAATVNNLASLYARDSRFGEAAALFERALAINQRLEGPDHPETVLALYNLANIYLEQGRPEEAVESLERVVESWRSNLGPSHPRLAVALEGLAGAYHALGRDELADRLFWEALAIREDALPPEHPAVANGLRLYADFLRDVDREAEAAALEERADSLQISRRHMPG